MVSMQQHPGGSVAIRIGDHVCYATDLSLSTKTLPLARGVRCLIHEAWSLGLQPLDSPHSGLAEAMVRAEESGTPRLIPTHFGPETSEEEIRSLSGFSHDNLEVLVPIEGVPIRIGPAGSP
jgi:ribonuclease BN (tRNA processing enzyme)